MRRSERYVATFKEESQTVQIHPMVLNIYEWAGTIVTSFLFVFILLAFVFRIATVSGSSMEPTLQNGNSIIVSNLESRYNYGDIVVVSQPNFLDENLIKRVIAVGGDTVDIDFEKGNVFVNGKKLNEPYLNSLTTRRFPDNFSFPITVPNGDLFVMGDNRNNSLDSRSQSIGFIDERYVFGKAYLRILPFGEWRIY
ncbi:MAG: signal peptidase I [Oscillospiraceae bacterium]